MSVYTYLESRILTITMVHSHHKPCVDIGLDTAVLEFINARVTESTPSQIYRDLMASGLPGSPSVAQYQVYYRWQQGNASSWRRDADQLQSAKMLLTEPWAAAQCDHEILISGNLRGLALFVRASMSSLRLEVRELAMDATSGTNNAGMNLFAVLAEVDGIGVPIAYCFVDVIASNDGVKRADPGALIHILEQFLQRVRQACFNPTFFGTDKDASEIAAVKLVWPETTLQLCYWHAKRAINTKLKDSTTYKTQDQYSPADALKLVPELEICWGSLPTRRPNGDHRYGRCECPSRATKFNENGRVEKMSTEEKDTVIQMFCRHFNYHSLIPDRNGTFRSAEEIHRECTSEMYFWCKARGFFRLWAYLFVNWYRHGQWELWARSSNATEIPVLKTTMIVESHWRRLKHDFLHRFNRPRIDLVVWILLTRVIPDVIARMRAVRSGDHRIGRAHWRKSLKRQWKALEGKIIDPDNIKRYHTDPLKWVCACEAFLQSRFLICKHLVHCISPFASPLDFFRNVERRRTWPFWEHDQLVILPQFRVHNSTDGVAAQSDDSDLISIADSSDAESEASKDPELEEETLSEDEPDEEVDKQSEDEADDSLDLEDFLVTMQSAMEIAREQHQKGNRAFVDKFMASNIANRILVEEVNRKRNRRSMNPTWGKYCHPATMYWN